MRFFTKSDNNLIFTFLVRVNCTGSNQIYITYIKINRILPPKANFMEDFSSAFVKTSAGM